MTGSEAKTENLENISSPIFLHIATHGFFNPTVSSENAMSMGIRITKAKENPLLRSGLLLSGAASVIRHEPSLGEKPNGILYAYHVMNFDLSSTELVVLSACETGLGEVVNGVGVYGLSRAFQVAGAGNIIMSLWKVDDEATQELMTAFYREWLQTGLTREAFHHAIQAVRKKYPSPFYWGAFVMIN
jgi:CHAT domain-containing protein